MAKGLITTLVGMVLSFLWYSASTFEHISFDESQLIKYGFVSATDSTIEVRNYSDTLLVQGEWKINETLVIKGAPVVRVRSGSVIELGEGASLLIHSTLLIEGDDSSKVIIRPIDPDRPFGVLAVIGTDKTHCSINHMALSGGAGDTISGVPYSGALSIRDCGVHISNSSVNENYSEDGLHLLRSSILMQNCSFLNNRSDQVDLDEVHGTIHGSTFSSSSKIRNGDGLDVSLSNIILDQSTIRGAKDKGLSAGEKSKVEVNGCHFEQNGIAIAAKDLSEVRVSSSNFMLNRNVFSAYQKKKKFGGGLIFDMGNSIDPSQLIDSTDAVSSIIRDEH